MAESAGWSPGEGNPGAADPAVRATLRPPALIGKLADDPSRSRRKAEPTRKVRFPRGPSERSIGRTSELKAWESQGAPKRGLGANRLSAGQAVKLASRAPARRRPIELGSTGKPRPS